MICFKRWLKRFNSTMTLNILAYKKYSTRKFSKKTIKRLLILVALFSFVSYQAAFLKILAWSILQERSLIKSLNSSLLTITTFSITPIIGLLVAKCNKANSLTPKKTSKNASNIKNVNSLLKIRVKNYLLRWILLNEKFLLFLFLKAAS